MVLILEDEPNEVCDKFYSLTVKAIDEFQNYAAQDIDMNPYIYLGREQGIHKTIERIVLRHLNVNISNPEELRAFVCKVICKFTQQITTQCDTLLLKKLIKSKKKSNHKNVICINVKWVFNHCECIL